jgi:hypothetical protein
MVSAGSAGAVMVAGIQYVDALPGIERHMMGGAFLQLAPGPLSSTSAPMSAASRTTPGRFRWLYRAVLP